MNGHIYERVELGKVKVIDLDGNESLFDDERQPPRAARSPRATRTCASGSVVRRPRTCSTHRSTTPTPPDGVESPTRACGRGSPPSVARRSRPAVRRRRSIVELFSDAELHRRDVLLGVPELVAVGRVERALLPIPAARQQSRRVHLRGDDVRAVGRPGQSPGPGEGHQVGPRRRLDDGTRTRPDGEDLPAGLDQPALRCRRASRRRAAPEIVFGNYNETKIRHFWEHLYHWLEIGPTQVTVTPR